MKFVNATPMLIACGLVGAACGGADFETIGQTQGAAGFERAAGRTGTGLAGTAGSAGGGFVTPPEPGTSETSGPVEVTASNVTSDSITLQWSDSEPAASTKIYAGPEPAPSPGAPLPSSQLVATLSGSDNSYTLAGLAPGVDWFVRVEREGLKDTRYGDAALRTSGGPRAQLASPVREVHAFGPSTLMIVLTGGDGAAWQTGNWELTRADGTPVRVISASRQSIPVSAPEYDVGWGKQYSDKTIDVDHRIFLQLEEPLGSRELFRVQGPSGVDFALPFSDRYLSTPVIQLNQVGYNPRATRRYAYVYAYAGDAGALSLDEMPAAAEVLAEPADLTAPRTSVVSGLALAQRAKKDKDADGEVREIDLSSVPASETSRYYVRIPGVGVSYPTEVSERAALKSFYVITRGIFLNRWAGDLKPQYTDWSRPQDHTTVYTGELQDFLKNFPDSTPKSGERPMLGGHHDAGDFDLRPMHTAVPQQLMRAFEIQPQAFADGQLTLPESGNGIPDLLDEALWNLSGWEQLQESDGGVRQGAQSTREPWGFYHAHEDPMVYWTFAREANLTSRVAGLFAQAARLVAPFDQKRAEGLQTRARKAWEYASARGANPSQLLYAAGELYALTGEEPFRAAFEQAWSDMGPHGAFSNFAAERFYQGDYVSNKRTSADFILGYVTSPGASDSIRTRTWAELARHADEAADKVESAHAHRNPRPSNRAQGWGQGITTNIYLDPIMAMLQMGGLTEQQLRRYYDALSLSADYVLGGNPNGLVYITGLGSRRVEEPLHLDSLTFVKKGLGVMPGIPVYGPVDDAPGASYSANTIGAFHPKMSSLPRALRYADVRNVVQCNEFTVWESQAPHAQLFAVLLGGNGTQPPTAWLPGQPRHRSALP